MNLHHLFTPFYVLTSCTYGLVRLDTDPNFRGRKKKKGFADKITAGKCPSLVGYTDEVISNNSLAWQTSQPGFALPASPPPLDEDMAHIHVIRNTRHAAELLR